MTCNESSCDPLLPVYPRLSLDLVRAEACWLYTRDDRKILDLYGAHAVSPLGHAHPRLKAVLNEAFSAVDFYSNSLHMAVQQQAAKRLLNASAHLAHVHFTNSGTEANEAAIHVARRLTGRRKVISFDCSFHGRTLASLSATGLASYRKRLSLPPNEADNAFIRYGNLSDLASIDDSVAAVICESVPSLAGVLMPPEAYYPAIASRCQQGGAVLIFDEVQGGIGRLGQWFAHQRFGVTPDIVTLAKSIAGGYPVGAMLTTSAIGEWIEHGELGTTFGGGPVACRMAATVAEVIQDEALSDRATQIFEQITSGLSKIADLQVRGAGCLIGIESKKPAKELRDLLLRHDILVGLSAHPNTVRLLPAYVLDSAEIDRFLAAMAEIF